jgi:hypothetical protein
MKLIKGPQQGTMTTETISTRMFTKVHGPSYKDPEAIIKLCERVAKSFWTESTRVPLRANGQKKAAEVRVVNNDRKRKRDANSAEAKAAADNAAISATGTVLSTNEPFEHPDYVAEPPPTEVTEKLVGRYCAKKMNDPNSLDGTWVLGRITKVNSTDVHKADGRNGEGKQHKKLRFTWKDRANRTELIKVRLRLRDYDINWVLFETKKKKKKKQKKKEQHPPQKSRAKGPKAAKTAK